MHASATYFTVTHTHNYSVLRLISEATIRLDSKSMLPISLQKHDAIEVPAEFELHVEGKDSRKRGSSLVSQALAITLQEAWIDKVVRWDLLFSYR